MPALAQPTAIEGVRRLIAYQGLAYAKLYLDRLRPSPTPTKPPTRTADC